MIRWGFVIGVVVVVVVVGLDSMIVKSSLHSPVTAAAAALITSFRLLASPFEVSQRDVIN